MASKQKKTNLAIIAAVYLAGIFMGAIDTGIVTPARTIIQNNLNVDEKTGIWMITIYTLAYAASIPVMGKLADKFGRKYVYLTSILLFGLGSLFCGLSQDFGSFTLLLLARVIQAIGGGGIMPVATAEFGTTFPPEKRGMALGLVGGVYGIANIFGSSAGSAILDIFGKNNWQFIFYINLPITLFILIAGFTCLPNNRAESVKKTDIWGILLLVSMVLSLLYGLKNIDFFNFAHTLGNTTVYPFLILFVLLLPFFILAEKKAQDPVMNLSYFTNRSILTTLILSFVVGIVMMGMIFVPQFAENELKIASGSGGYFVIILGLFAGVGAPVSGKLIDKFGPKVILGLGFIISAIGAVFLIFITTLYPNLVTVITSLVLIGLGMGFTIGTPLNYMMLENTRKEESNSALATLSLVRSVGTAIAPAIMIGFLAHAGANIQTNVMQLLPKEVSVPPLPYAQELTEKLNMLKKDPRMKDKLGNVEMPDLSSMTKVNIDMGGKSGFKMPENLVELMKSSDVTTITKNSKILAEEMFALMTPELVTKIQDGVQKGIDGLNSGLADMQKSAADLEQGYKGISEGINGMQSALDSQKQALEGLESLMAAFTKMPQGMPQGAGMPSGNPMRSAAMSNGMPLSGQISTPKSIIDMIPAQIKKNIPDQVLEQLKTIKTPKDLQAKIDELKAAMTALEAKLDEATKNQADMEKALEGIRAAQTDMNDTLTKMVALRDAVPQAFVTAKNNYLQEIDRMKGQLEGEFQKTLNAGFKQVYLTVAIASFIALIILAFYKKREDSGEYDLSPKVSENLE